MHRLFRDLGVAVPIIQAPMAGAQDEQMAIAVSNTGGVGSLACALLEPSAVYSAVQRFRSRATGPINLNFFCHAEPEYDRSREASWLAELDRYYTEFALDRTYDRRTPIRALDSEMTDVVSAARPEIVSFHFGLPPIDLLARVRSTGAMILVSATTMEEAAFLQDQGCDGVILQGIEAGGHRGTFLDASAVQKPLTDVLTEASGKLSVPLIAAGGIADADGIRAAMQAGAAGVQIGTRFLKSPESCISAPHRAILEADEPRETAVTNVFTGRSARSIVNRLIRETGPINPEAQVFPLAMSAVAPIKAATPGSEDFVPLWAGQNWQIGRSMPVAQIMAELSAAYEHRNKTTNQQET